MLKGPFLLLKRFENIKFFVPFFVVCVVVDYADTRFS